MRIKYDNIVYEIDSISFIKERFVTFTFSLSKIIIDCEKLYFSQYLLSRILEKGYFDASGLDFIKVNILNNRSMQEEWINKYLSKNREQMKFFKYIMG